jgi:threonine aldolase
VTLIDLRSDTVTRPTAAMREAMARAEVGDDVYGEDPTVNALQEAVAERLGFAAALLVPSGTMANQIAIKVHTQPGDEILAGESAHLWLYESGAAAAFSGVQVQLLGRGGLFDADEVRAAAKPGDDHFAPLRLCCLENTHNRSGGRVWPAAQVGRVQAAAHALGLALHLDGARLWNAAVASGRPPRELAAGFDTVAVCLSKGLGAPVGSLLCGSRELIARAHRYRKLLGGGMRQAGILAAAGLHALAHHVERLAEDHENARLLAGALAGHPRLGVDPAAVETNMVMVDLLAGAPDGAAVVAALRARGVLASAFAPRRLRLCTHLDVDRAGCLAAAAALIESCEP